jgi:hypothetical protein
MPATSWSAASSRAIGKYRSVDDADIKGSTKIPAEMTIPTFEPACLAEIYWEMANKRDRAEVIPQATG